MSGGTAKTGDGGDEVAERRKPDAGRDGECPGADSAGGGEGAAARWLRENITLHSKFTAREELANGFTHLAGVVLAVAGTVLMAAEVISGNTVPGVGAGAIVFGITMIVLYGASTAYHLVRGPVVKRIARIADHASIYFLIAGTYTPVMVWIGTPPAHNVLIAVWALTAVGILFTLVYWGRYGVLHVVFYLAMGWTIVLIWGDVVATVTPAFLRWAIAGGLSYTAGTLVYGAHRVPYHHAIWHLFVLGGSICFFFGIYPEIVLGG